MITRLKFWEVKVSRGGEDSEPKKSIENANGNFSVEIDWSGSKKDRGNANWNFRERVLDFGGELYNFLWEGLNYVGNNTKIEIVKKTGRWIDGKNVRLWMLPQH